MPKARKNQAAEIHFGPVIKVALICCCFCGLAVFYVWQKNEIVRLGQRISKDEQRLEQLRDDNELLREQEYVLSSQRMIAARSQELGLGLGPVQPGQVVRLTEPAPGGGGPPRELAGR